MNEKPIPFSSSMVRAILEGHKTMTRRVIKLPTKGEYVRPDMGGWAPSTLGGGGCFRIAKDGSRIAVAEHPVIWNQTTGTCLGVTYEIGDRLWVRETHSIVPKTAYWHDSSIPHVENDDKWAVYKQGWERSPPTWRPSIHMPRWASRITLEVIGVKVERLQDISEDDAKAEGILSVDNGFHWLPDKPNAQWATLRYRTAKDAFCGLWQSINGADSWDANPWVVVINFKRVQCPRQTQVQRRIDDVRPNE